MMKNFLTILLVLANLGIPTYADTSVDIKKGNPAPFDGVVLDNEKATNIRNELLQKDATDQTNESLNKTVLLYKNNETIYQGENDLLLKHNSDLISQLNSTKTLSNWEKVGFFLLGVAVTGLAIHEAGKLR